MKSYYENLGFSDWQSYDWSSIAGTRLFFAVAEQCPNLERLFGKGQESYSEEEWRTVREKLVLLADLQKCHECLPFDTMYVRGFCGSVEGWLSEAVRLGIIGETERRDLSCRLHEHFGF